MLTARKDHCASNLALIRRMALNLLRSAEDFKLSIRRRKERIGFSDEYRYQRIFGNKRT